MASKGRKISIKKLESFLQDLDGFNEPKVKLEQYITPPHIAALILNEIHSNFDDIQGNVIADLGCGPSILSIGSLFCGSSMVFGFDIDRDSLNDALENYNQAFDSDDNEEDSPLRAYRACGSFNLIMADVASEDYDNFWTPWHKKFDTVIMNPPFGTKDNQGLDMLFLRRALDLADGAVYSLHKSSTRKHIQGQLQQWGHNGKPIAQLRYNLDETYRFHKRKSVDIDVDLWRIKLG